MMIGKCKKGKKRVYLVLALFLALGLLMTSSAQAELTMFSRNQEVETYVIPNSNGVTSLQTNVSTTSGGSGGEGISAANHRILGYRVVPYNNSLSAELTLALYDVAKLSTVTALTLATYLLDEAEYDDDGNNIPQWYAYPVRIKTQLTTLQGPNTVVVIYYEDKRKR